MSFVKRNAFAKLKTGSSQKNLGSALKKNKIIELKRWKIR